MKYLKLFEKLEGYKYILCVDSNVPYFIPGKMYKIIKEGKYGAWHYSRSIKNEYGEISRLLTDRPEPDYLEMFGFINDKSDTLAIFSTKKTVEEYELENATKKYNL